MAILWTTSRQKNFHLKLMGLGLCMLSCDKSHVISIEISRSSEDPRKVEHVSKILRQRGQLSTRTQVKPQKNDTRKSSFKIQK